MAEPVELNEFLAKDFGMSYSVTCNVCGDEVTNIVEKTDIEMMRGENENVAVDDDAEVLIILHDCNEDADEDDDDDWDDDDEDED